MESRLRTLRLEKRLTLRELSEEVNISYSNIAMIERGERNYTSDTLKIFANYFEVSTDYLLGKTDERKAATITPTAKEQLKGVKLALYNQMEDLTEDQAEDVLNFMNFIKSKGK